MTFTAWRITKRKHAREAFTGKGAREFGGRWNSPGIAVVYTSETQSLAALEMLVHLDSPALLQKYVLISVEIEDGLVRRLDRSQLPKNWHTEPPPAEVRVIGDRWVLSRESVVLCVPSAIVPAEHNFLLNPGHPDFVRLCMGKPMPFQFDRRLTENG